LAAAVAMARRLCYQLADVDWTWSIQEL
jgi:hypothetical protein